jgi:hypothetical protein
MAAGDDEEVERVLSAVESRAFADSADALAALAEASRAVSEAWRAAPPTPGGGREESLRARVGRLRAIADRAALYGGATGYSVTFDDRAGLSVTVRFGDGGPAGG